MIDDLRRDLGERVEALYPEEIAGLIRGMILGEREAVPPDAEEDFALLGLAHLLAISGLHVGVFVGAVYGLLKGIGLTREKAAGLVILLLPLIVLLTGAGAPVIRAAIMAGLALLAVILRRWKDGLTFLAVAAWALLIWNPYQLFQPGFQLSFVVTLALLVAVGPVSRIMPFPWRWLNQLVAVTLVAQLASFPLLIFHFYEFSVLSWVANLVAVPVVSLWVIPLSMAALALGAVHEGLASIPAMLSSAGLSALLKGLGPLARWNRLHPAWPPPPTWWLAAYVAVCFQGLIAWTGDVPRRKVHRIAFAFLMGGLIAFAWSPDVWAREKELRITFLDVGQGDSAVIETPGGQVILVDGGGVLPYPRESWQRRRKESDSGRDVVVPYLKYRGIRSIDYLVITHGDADHVGGLAAVAERFPVRRVIRSPREPAEMERRLLRLLRDRGAKVYAASRGSGWSLEPGISWQFLHPEPVVPPGEQTNDDSVVFLLSATGGGVDDRGYRGESGAGDRRRLGSAFGRLAKGGPSRQPDFHPSRLAEGGGSRPCSDLRRGEKPFWPPGAGGDPAAGGTECRHLADGPPRGGHGAHRPFGQDAGGNDARCRRGQRLRRGCCVVHDRTDLHGCVHFHRLFPGADRRPPERDRESLERIQIQLENIKETMRREQVKKIWSQREEKE